MMETTQETQPAEKFKKGQRVHWKMPDAKDPNIIIFMNGSIVEKSKEHVNCWYVKGDDKIVYWVSEKILKIPN